MANFYTDIIQKDSRFHSTAAIRDIALLEPSFAAAVKKVIAGAKVQNIELVVTETYRSSERQQALFAQKLTQLRTVGVHHYGLAADLVIKKPDGSLDWTDTHYQFMCKLAVDNGIISGGDWGQPNVAHSFRDWDHVQGCTLDQQNALFAGTWYPNADAGNGGTAPIPPPATMPAVKPLTPATGLTAAQALALTTFDPINAASFANFFWRSSFMAFCEIESGFNIKAFRQEPSGVASYGLMQVLDSTAAGLGLSGAASQMYDPKIGIFYGLKYAAQGWNYLQTHLGRTPTLVEWCSGYNEGYGAAAQGKADTAYSNKWCAAQIRWAKIFNE